MNDTRDERIAASVWPRPGLKEQAAAARTCARHRKSLLQAVIMSAVGLGLVFAAKKPVAGAVACVLAAVVFACGRVFPRAHDMMERTIDSISNAVGIALTWILLVPFFAVVFVPARLLIALSGKDPLCRRFKPGHETFWVPHRDAGTGGYGKQY